MSIPSSSPLVEVTEQFRRALSLYPYACVCDYSIAACAYRCWLFLLMLQSIAASFTEHWLNCNYSMTEGGVCLARQNGIKGKICTYYYIFIWQNISKFWLWAFTKFIKSMKYELKLLSLTYDCKNNRYRYIKLNLKKSTCTLTLLI